MERTEVSPGAKLCWARLAQYAGRDGVAFPEQETLAEAMGVSSRQVKRYVAELVDAKLIRTDQTRGFNRQNHYYFLKHPWMSAVVSPSKGPDVSPSSGPDASPSKGPDVSGPSKGRESVRRESGEEIPATPAASAQTFLASLIDYIRIKTNDPDYQPDGRTRGIVARQLAEVVSAGARSEHIIAGCRAWADSDKHPSTLTSFIDTARRGGNGHRRAHARNGAPIASPDELDQLADLLEAQQHADRPTDVAPPSQADQRQLPGRPTPTRHA
jgi:hypothetical protein